MTILERVRNVQERSEFSLNEKRKKVIALQRELQELEARLKSLPTSNQTVSGGNTTVQDVANNILHTMENSQREKKRLTEELAKRVDMPSNRIMPETVLQTKYWVQEKENDRVIISVPCGFVVFQLTVNGGGLNNTSLEEIKMSMTRINHDIDTQQSNVVIDLILVYTNGGIQRTNYNMKVNDSDLMSLTESFGRKITVVDRSNYKKWECYHMMDDNGKQLITVCDKCKCVM